MKKFLMAAVMMVYMSTSFANNEEVNPAVQTAFKTRFPKAINVEWTTGAKYYKARFTANGSTMFAFYNERAELIGVMKNVNPDQLPMPLQGKIKTYYTHY